MELVEPRGDLSISGDPGSWAPATVTGAADTATAVVVVVTCGESIAVAGIVADVLATGCEAVVAAAD